MSISKTFFLVVFEMWKPPDREVRRLFFMACA
nr:MAG TPA: Protein of unknown function (DUF2868) [Bacteriophage sp.]